MIIKLYFCNTIIETATNNKLKIKIMTTENFKTIDDILESEFFNQMFDFETEKKEIEQAGWNYNELRKFGQELSKKIEPKN
jgi:hypothetical protein